VAAVSDAARSQRATTNCPCPDLTPVDHIKRWSLRSLPVDLGWCTWSACSNGLWFRARSSETMWFLLGSLGILPFRSQLPCCEKTTQGRVDVWTTAPNELPVSSSFNCLHDSVPSWHKPILNHLEHQDIMAISWLQPMIFFFFATSLWDYSSENSSPMPRYTENCEQ
jgi:hypothetical protein